MKIHWEKDSDTAFVDFKEVLPGSVKHTILASEEVFEVCPHAIYLRFDNDGRLIGLKVFGASKVLPQELPDHFCTYWDKDSDGALVYFKEIIPGSIKRSVLASIEVYKICPHSIHLQFDKQGLLAKLNLQGASEVLPQELLDQAYTYDDEQ